MLGESVTYGWLPPVKGKVQQAKYAPHRVLKRLARELPKDNPWYGARFINLAVPGADSYVWLEGGENDIMCTDWARGSAIPLLKAACPLREPLLAHLKRFLPRKPDLILFIPAASFSGFDPTVAVERMQGVLAYIDSAYDATTPIPVIWSAPPAASIDPWKTWFETLRAYEKEHGVINGIADWPPLPFSDGVHLSEGPDGGYAQFAALLMDVLAQWPRE